MSDAQYLVDLQDAIHSLHDARSTHLGGVRVKETFQGATVWDGTVEIFAIHDHPTLSKVYAWAHDTDIPRRPRRYVVVLHSHPVTSPQAAVRAAIFQEFRNASC